MSTCPALETPVVTDDRYSGEVEGNHLDFVLDPSGLTPGEYTLEVRALEDQGTAASATAGFWVVEPPFGRGPE